MDILLLRQHYTSSCGLSDIIYTLVSDEAPLWWAQKNVPLKKITSRRIPKYSLHIYGREHVLWKFFDWSSLRAKSQENAIKILQRSALLPTPLSVRSATMPSPTDGLPLKPMYLQHSGFGSNLDQFSSKHKVNFFLQEWFEMVNLRLLGINKYV